jgi:hypothetical protein
MTGPPFLFFLALENGETYVKKKEGQENEAHDTRKAFGLN